MPAEADVRQSCDSPRYFPQDGTHVKGRRLGVRSLALTNAHMRGRFSLAGGPCVLSCQLRHLHIARTWPAADHKLGVPTPFGRGGIPISVAQDERELTSRFVRVMHVHLVGVMPFPEIVNLSVLVDARVPA